MDTEKQKLYDQVISTLITNVMSEKKLNKRIILRDFNCKDPSHMLYYEASAIISDISGCPIYLNMNLWDYIKFVYRNIKRWKNLKWVSNGKIAEWELNEGNNFTITPVNTILVFVKEFYLEEKKLNFSEFDTIYEQVYGGKDGTDSCD